jgi:hypothetical protein
MIISYHCLDKPGHGAVYVLYLVQQNLIMVNDCQPTRVLLSALNVMISNLSYNGQSKVRVFARSKLNNESRAKQG